MTLKKTDVRRVKMDGEDDLIEREVFLTEDIREVVKLNDQYYYLSKSGLKILTRKYVVR